MAVKLKKSKTAVAAVVSTERSSGAPQQESVPVRVVESSGEPMANVGFSASMTRNLGNYESVKFTVALYMPVPVDLSAGADPTPALDANFQYVQQWVDAKIGAMLDELNE